MGEFTKKKENCCREVGLIVVKLLWNLVFISMNENAVLSELLIQVLIICKEVNCNANNVIELQTKIVQ